MPCHMKTWPMANEIKENSRSASVCLQADLGLLAEECVAPIVSIFALQVRLRPFFVTQLKYQSEKLI